jgi:Nucleotidyl transferase AbiEii toxin, Type IV TA system
MFGADVLTFREFMMGEPLPLATVQQAVLEFLRGRDDVVVFGAQAVNAYVQEPRMTQDLDLMSTNAEEVAQALCSYLRQRFHIAVRIRRVGGGHGLRLFQVRKAGNRHLVDLRLVESLPLSERIADVLVMAPAELIASKVIAYEQRRGQPKSGTDWRDLAVLLLAFPDLKRDPGPVSDRLRATGATPAILAAWQALVAQEIRPANEEDW